MSGRAIEHLEIVFGRAPQARKRLAAFFFFFSSRDLYDYEACVHVA